MVKGAEVSIRPATTGDLTRLGELAAQLLRMHHEVDPARFFLPDRVEEGYEWWLGRELARKEAVVIVGAMDERVVGYAYGTREERDWNMLLDEFGAIHDLFVVPEARGAGVGRKLLEALMRELERLGAPRLVLHTMVSNEPAKRLFAACGFRATMVEMTRT
jgi:ribosomal protein S18 acetylase RimI-like enzyme